MDKERLIARMKRNGKTNIIEQKLKLQKKISDDLTVPLVSKRKRRLKYNKIQVREILFYYSMCESKEITMERFGVGYDTLVKMIRGKYFEN